MKMNKKTNKSSSIADIIEFFKTDPKQAYDRLAASGYYFYTKQSDKFWSNYEQLDHEGLKQQFPEFDVIFNKVGWLKFFYNLKKILEKERDTNISDLVKLNPTENSLIKSLFISLELGDTTPQPTKFPNYSDESLEAIKILIKKILPQLKSEKKTTYSIELATISCNLIRVQIDISLLLEFVDAFVWAGLIMKKGLNTEGFELTLPEEISRKNNLFILNCLKTAIKRDFESRESHPKISEEEHFKTNDPQWKTQEGLATLFHSSGITITSQTPGTTSLQFEDNSIMTDISSADPKKREQAFIKTLLQAQEQNFHYKFRHTLAGIYHPNDQIDIHALHLKINSNEFVSLYDLICVMSCIIARADVFFYLEHMHLASFISIKNQFISKIQVKYPLITLEEAHQIANSTIIHQLPEIEKSNKHLMFHFVDINTILGWLRKIEELKTKSETELIAMIDLLSSLDSPLPFNPLYKIEDKYYFSYKSCDIKFNLNRKLYDNYISDKLFNPNNKPSESTALIQETQKNRETRFTNSLKEIFKTITPFVESGLKYGDPKTNYDFGELRGEFDVIAYFEKENIIIPIQVKLSNVSPRSEKRKKEWIITRIEDKGINQVVKDIKLLQFKSGLKFIADKLNFNSEIKQPRIYPLIVSDTFFVDHVPFNYNKKGNHVLCVSFFELKHLIFNQKIHLKQDDWLPLERDHAASRLIQIIENNTFWDFLRELTEGFKFEKSLKAINKEFKIRMIV
jgi:hypothetical protein